jgi:hypothetical protein
MARIWPKTDDRCVGIVLWGALLKAAESGAQPVGDACGTILHEFGGQEGSWAVSLVCPRRLKVFASFKVLAWVLILCGPSVPSPGATIYLARRGWHVDVGLMVADLAPPLSSAATPLPTARYLFFGFADKHYLLAKNHSAPVVLAALWPGVGIILATGLSDSPAAGFGEGQVISLTVNPEQMRALQSFVWKSLATRGDAPIIEAPGPYDDSIYFLAVPKYSAVHTCNTWGAQALRATGFHVHTAGVVFAGQLWTQARRLERAQRRALLAAPQTDPR